MTRLPRRRPITAPFALALVLGVASGIAGCGTAGRTLPEPGPPPGASAAEHARHRAERLAVFDADGDGQLSPPEAAAAAEGERRARRDPETIMRYETMRQAHRDHLEAMAAGEDEARMAEVAAELESARTAWRERRREMLTGKDPPAPGP